MVKKQTLYALLIQNQRYEQFYEYANRVIMQSDSIIEKQNQLINIQSIRMREQSILIMEKNYQIELAKLQIQETNKLKKENRLLKIGGVGLLLLMGVSIR